MKQYRMKNFTCRYAFVFMAPSDAEAIDVAHDQKTEGGEKYTLTCVSDNDRLVFDSRKVR